MLASCKSNLQSAQVDSLVELHQQDFFSTRGDTATKQAEPGLLIFNPPYGERLATGNTAAGNSTTTFYRDINKTLRSSFNQWQIGILTPADAPTHLLRLSGNAAADKGKIRKNKKQKSAAQKSSGLGFSNGGIDCRYMSGMVSGGSTGTAASIWLSLIHI